MASELKLADSFCRLRFQAASSLRLNNSIGAWRPGLNALSRLTDRRSGVLPRRSAAAALVSPCIGGGGAIGA